jgi:uncharacterized protein (DUF1501 family)
MPPLRARPSPLALHRRGFLQGSAAAFTAGAAGLLAPRPARAAVSAADRRFLFVFNNGGWDPTRVFAPVYEHREVDLEPEGERATSGGITYVDHPGRPSVRAFFDAHHANTLVLNGVQVRSIAHEICTMIALTGDTSGFKPDFATIIAAHDPGGTTLPHLVLDGPSFPGELGTSVARTGANGQLDALLSGEIRTWTDTPGPTLPASYEGLLDRYLARRASGRAAAARGALDGRLAAAWQDAHRKALGLEEYRYVMDFATAGDLDGQVQVAVDALGTGLARCVSLGFPGAAGGLGWDIHSDNDDTQSALFEGLFGGLNQLIALLQSTPGVVAGGTLLDETLVVVLSEMGRTPKLNNTLGKDHWPYTSMMLVGGGITPDRVVGAYDEGHAGRLVDPRSGELSDGGRILSAEGVGAALLQLADIDPADWIDGAVPVEGILS